MSLQTDRIESANADYVDWRFRIDSENVFAIKVSVVVEWRVWNDLWDRLDKVGETPISNIISIANYWK